MKTLKDEWRVVIIMAYKLAVFEILRFFVLAYITRPRYPYI